MPVSGADTTLKTRLLKDLRRAIILGHLRPGDKLVIRDIALEYGTSVTPVREALQMLAQEDLVTVRPHSGYLVTQITLRQLRDLLDLREVLELASVERAAGRITEEQIAELSAVSAGYSGDDDESYERYTAENRRFHYLIGVASGNAELADALGRLHDRLARFMVIRRAGRVMQESHQRIIDALCSHNRQAAGEAMRAELDDAREVIMGRVIEEEGDSWRLSS
jgi:DNA-binding GntR family transcriptional regulator